MATFISHNANETIAWAREWARSLRPNDIVALRGELGAGKTHFVKGLVAGRGSDDDVTSPTFTLLHEYRGGDLPIFHFDFYRITKRSEIEQIDFEEYCDADGITVVEWADRFPELFPPRTRRLDLVARNDSEREISEAVR